MAQVQPLYRRPSWWGPNWLGLPVAFWLSVLISAATAGAVAWVLLPLLVPDLYRPISLEPASTRFASDFYETIAFVLGALPPLYPWHRALHRRGLHSWDDD